MQINNISTLLVFIISIQFFSIFLTNEFLISKIVEVIPYEPFGNETPVQASSNSFALILMIIAMTIAMIAVIKIFGKKLLKYIFLTLSLFLIFVVNNVYIAAIMQNHFKPFLNDLIVLLTTFVLIVATVYGTIKNKSRLLLIVSFVVLAEVGSFLAQTFVPPTLYAILIGFALYDVFAVFYGPLKYFMRELGFPKAVGVVKSKSSAKKIEIKIEKLKRELSLGILLVNIGGIMMGSGDLVFYSLIASAAFMLGGFVASIAVIAAVVIGVVINTIILQKYRRVFPGLPIPILLAIIPILIFS